MKTFASRTTHRTTHHTTRRLAHLAMVAAVLAGGLAIQPARAAEPVSRVIQLPTVVVVAKRTPVLRLETVVVTARRSAPLATFVAERSAPAAALKAGSRV